VLQDDVVDSEETGRRGGQLLTGSALVDVLDRRVFVPGSWEPTNVRGAGYDIRLSATGMIVPAGERGELTRSFGPENPKQLPVILEPGETAVVSSEERFCMDFNIAGNIGPKFRLAAQGLLVLTGLALDPGYGRQLDSSGEWLPMADQRLHFVLANVGVKSISLTPGTERIAFLQLFAIEDVKPSETLSLGWGALTESLFESPDGATVIPGGLAYFRNVRDLKLRVEAMERTVQETTSSVDKIEKASNYVVVFGVFLVAVTILGLVLNALIGAVDNLPAHASQLQELLVYGATGAYGLGVLSIVWLAVRRTR
jgi:deoxycytidine triphosphate deaminase